MCGSTLSLLAVYWPYLPLPPYLYSPFFYLLFLLVGLVPGFSGHRLVQDCQCLPSSCLHFARVPSALAHSLFCHSLIFALGVITLTLTYFVPSLFWSFCARQWVVRPPFCFSLAPAPLPPLFVSVLSLGCPFSPPSPWPLLALRFPRVLCLVFLAVDWSRISSTALTSPPLFGLLRCFPTAPLPFRYSLA